MNDASNVFNPTVSTGISGFDTLLGGGLLPGGLYLIEGMPGSGKTILASQISFHQVRNGGHVLFVTLIAESHTKLLRNLRSLSFYDEASVSSTISFVSGYHELMSGGLSGFLKLVASALRDKRPSFMVIDGFASAREFSESSLALSTFIHELNALVALAECTTILLAPLSGNEPHPEHTLVDGLIELNRHEAGMRRIREIEVHKIRGCAPVLGRHSFEITSDGITIYPRLEALPLREPGYAEHQPRMAFGVARLDAMVDGGLIRGSSTALVGASGTGKTLLALKFMDDGVKNGEKCMFFGFHESPARLLAKAAAVGMELKEACGRGDLEIIWRPAIEHCADELVATLLNAVERHKTVRLAVDGIEGFRDSSLRQERFGLLWTALSGRLRAMGVTILLTHEIALYSEAISIEGLYASASFENIVVTRYIEGNSEVRRAISVMKTRGSRFDPTIRGLTIDERGLDVTDGFLGSGYVLSGHGVLDPSASRDRPAANVSRGKGSRRKSE